MECVDNSLLMAVLSDTFHGNISCIFGVWEDAMLDHHVQVQEPERLLVVGDSMIHAQLSQVFINYILG